MMFQWLWQMMYVHITPANLATIFVVLLFSILIGQKVIYFPAILTEIWLQGKSWAYIDDIIVFFLKHYNY